jgi:subtilase family serine protease
MGKGVRVKPGKVLLCLAALLMVVACSSPQVAPPAPSSPRQIQSEPSALPGDDPSAMPGDDPSAMPGASLGCDLTFEADQANCTIAININIPPLSDATAPASMLSGLHPADLQNRYRLPAQNAGGTVAVVDAYDDPNAESDLAVYRTAFGLPACTSLNGCFTKVNEQGAASSYPAENVGWSEEISLDLDMVSAVCPNCKILLVEANSPSFDDLGASVDRAATMSAAAISNSYYGPEWSGETAYDVHYNHPGIAITVAAGDQTSPFYPAASPYVTSIGGTTLSGSAGSWNESAWTYTGQGCSKYESKPSWQVANPCKSKRSTVDIAAVADPQTGVTMYDSSAGGWLVAGGTSAGTPIVAAAYALSANPQGPSYSYAHAKDFYKIGGSNYTLATGLGSPDGVGGL